MTIDPRFPFLRGEDFWFEGVRKQTLEKRRKETLCVADFIDHLLLFDDLAVEGYSKYDSVKDQVTVLYMMQDLIIREWTGYLMSLVYGAYENCARCLRWVLETGILTAAAVFDAKLLNRVYPEGPMKLSTYETYLKEKDEGDIVFGRHSREETLQKLDFRRDQILPIIDAYSQLCSFCHPSRHTVVVRREDRDFDWLYKFDSKEFDRIHSLTYKVIDTTLSILLRCYRKLGNLVSTTAMQDFVQYAESYRYHFFGFNRPPSMRQNIEWKLVPMTRELLLRYRKENDNPSPLRYTVRPRNQ